MPFKLATSHLSLRQLRAFLAVAQESSMTRAATQLHLTPSALSMLVRSMEDDLGMRLRAADKGNMQCVGQFQVLPKASLTAQQRRVFTAQGGGDGGVSHYASIVSKR